MDELVEKIQIATAEMFCYLSAFTANEADKLFSEYFEKLGDSDMIDRKVASAFAWANTIINHDLAYITDSHEEAEISNVYAHLMDLFSDYGEIDELTQKFR